MSDSSEDDTFIDFVGYEPEEVLQALHDSAKTYNNSVYYQRFGSLNLDYAGDLLATRDTIDYLNGRFLHVSFASFPLIDSEKYDKVNGRGAMLATLDMLAKRADREK
jgi:hypothetical protein